MINNQNLKIINKIYNRYHKKKYIATDPLKFIYKYKNIKDREICGLITSSLTFGRVNQINIAVSDVLNKMGNSLHEFVKLNTYNKIYKTFKNFKYRFVNDKQITALIFNIKTILNNHGSLKNCFKNNLINSDQNIFSSLCHFSKQLCNTKYNPGFLIPNPQKKSACKRLNLFLRWMIRKDNIDPGVWDSIHPSMLNIPLDTHMYKIGFNLGFTKQQYINYKTVTEITSHFKQISPEDPTKYDFSLTRWGMLNPKEINDYFCKKNNNP